MTNEIQIIGDRIEFMGYHVGKLQDVPCSIRNRFIDLLEHSSPTYAYTNSVKTGMGKVR